MIIGVTGKTGSGKNVVANYLEKLGFKHYDLDLIAHKIIDENRDEIVQFFGINNICDYGNGPVNRAKLGKIVFSDLGKLKALERMIHPKLDEYLFNEMKKDLNASPERDIVLNAAILSKSMLHYACNPILFIDAPPIKRFFRLLKRDNRSMRNIIKRMRSQKDIKTSNYISTIKLNNDSSRGQMLTYVDSLVKTKNKYDNFLKEIKNM